MGKAEAKGWGAWIDFVSQSRVRISPSAVSTLSWYSTYLSSEELGTV